MTTRRSLLHITAAFAATIASLRSPQVKATSDSADFLFIQTADAMTFDKADSKLTLRRVGAITLFFYERPERIAGNMNTTASVPFWGTGEDSFLSDPPNADLSILKGTRCDRLWSFWRSRN